MENRDIKIGDVVRHFKRQYVDEKSTKYLYKVLNFAIHSETDQVLVIYQALYPPFIVSAREYNMFFGEVDLKKYPDSKQKFRFEKEDKLSDIYQNFLVEEK